MKALVLVNGELYEPGILRLRIRAEGFDLVIGADRGAKHAETLGVTLHAVIGDMDSLTGPEQQQCRGARFISYPAMKNETDLELALLYARELGAGKIVLAGALGGRMDMTIGNILLLAQANLVSGRIEVWHGAQTGWIIKPPGEEITGQPGDTVSLIPLGGGASDIVTEGLAYPLKNEDLPVGAVRGISNVMEKTSARVTFKDGLLLVTHTPGRA
jgi:thiamine pyrophosphokinase